jgi:hypothetical protein
MQEAGTERAPLRTRAWEELRTWLLLSAWLAVFFCAFTAYRNLTLGAEGEADFRYGASVVEALVVAKFILLGRALRVGEKPVHGPLIVPVLYQTGVYGLLVLAFSVLERLIEGALHRRRPLDVLEGLLAEGSDEILARTLVLLLALLPLCALIALGRALGAGRLSRLFFAKKGP